MLQDSQVQALIVAECNVDGFDVSAKIADYWDLSFQDGDDQFMRYLRTRGSVLGFMAAQLRNQVTVAVGSDKVDLEKKFEHAMALIKQNQMAMTEIIRRGSNIMHITQLSSGAPDMFDTLDLFWNRFPLDTQVGGSTFAP